VPLLRREENDVHVRSDPSVGSDQDKKLSGNELTGSTLASINPPAIGVLYNLLGFARLKIEEN
jgi:hypothetical protein